MEKDLAEILISSEQIMARNAELAHDIVADFQDRPTTVIILSNGAIIFGADLVRQMSIPLELDVLSAKSYTGTRSRGEVEVAQELHVSIADRHVLVVDDIFDSGLTLSKVVSQLQTHGPREIRTCVLLNKQRPREIKLQPDYIGFPVEDQFVVGYGLDYNHQYRNLPYIGVLHARLYTDTAE